MITIDSIVVVIPDQASADLGGETAILNLRNGEYYGLNETASFIWSHIQEPTAVSQVRDTILTEYKVNTENCEHHLITLLEKLLAENLIEVRHDHHP